MSTPKVRIARPANRPFQLRYTCPIEGREVRISTGTRDESEAARQRRELEAKLLLGLPSRKPVKATGPNMPWEEFREAYRELQLITLRDKTAIDAESRLDIATRILKPRTLGDVADAEALHRLQTKLLAGADSRRGKPRSVHTVRGYMGSVLAAVNWARFQGWIDSMPAVRKVKAGKVKVMKGRPITTAEFERLLASTVAVVGDEAAPSWRYVLQGLWASALRLDELMHVSWDIPHTIRPMRREGRLPVLDIPGPLQKNAADEAIPLLPWFESVLLETPLDDRTGWVFDPKPLAGKHGRSARYGRPKAEWVGKIISKIGKVADVTVDPGDQRTGRPTKYASAHDLRRSCAERLLDAGVPPMVITRVMRHASWETTRRHYAPGDIQKDANLLREYLGTVSGGIDVSQYTPEDSNL